MDEHPLVEKEFPRLIAARLVLARQLNALTLPSRLPPELLAEVLAYLSPLIPYEYTSDALLKASHVSQHWREVALQFPTLWRNIELGRKPEYMRMILKRSRNCPLYVTGYFTEDKLKEDELVAILNEVHRIRFLGAYMVSKLVKSIQRLHPEKLSAPLMTTYMEGPAYPDTYRDTFVAYEDSKESSLLSLFDAPNLESLQLTARPDAWKPLFSLAGLKSLRVIACDQTHLAIAELIRSFHKIGRAHV